MQVTVPERVVVASGSIVDRKRTEQPPSGLIYLDAGPSKHGWHRLQTFITCKHLYALKNLLKLQFRGKKATGLGTLLHVALAHRYARLGAKQGGVEVDPLFVQDRPGLVTRGAASLTESKFGLQASIRDPETFMLPLDAMAWAWDHDPRLLDRRQDNLLDKAKALLAAYDAYWIPREKIRVLAVELMLETTVTSPITGQTYPYTQRLDLAWKDTMGGAWISDHKTAQDPNIDTYNLEGQIAGLRNFGLMRWGNTFRGVDINWLQTDEAPYKFKREAPHLAHEVTAEFSTTVAETEDELAWYRATHPDPWKWRRSVTEHACKTRYGRCDAYNLCIGRTSRPPAGGTVDT